MNKENIPPGPTASARSPAISITDEQRNRITQNFRVAKALLARKRPFDSSFPTPTLSKCINTKGSTPRATAVHLVPLADIQPGAPPAVNAFATPSRMPGSCSVNCSDVVSPGSILDEELDDDFLREVDAICEEKSATKTERPCIVKSDVPGGNCTGKSEGSGNSTVENEGTGEGGILFRDSNCNSETEKYRDYLLKLNDAQREAACCDISVPLMVVAGPGSGKTSTMVGRVLTLLKEGIGPANILAMTFTTAAASEMRDRIGAVVGKKVAKELAISTFHSFCLQLCRLHAQKLDRTTEFLIYGHGQQRRAVLEALRLNENAEKNENLNGCHNFDEISGGASALSFKEKSKKWQKFVAQAKASGRTSEHFKKMGDGIGASILGHYNDILKSCNALDYHDFISSSVKLLDDFPEVYKECTETWKAIIVDEFQDTSSMQYRLLRLLASHNRVTIVGDDDQSIFSFNGANVSGFASFRRDFPTHKEIRLNKNYRSTRCIVEAASALICNNAKRCQLKKVETDNSTGCKITVKVCHNEDAQCAFVVDKLLEITSDSSASTRSFGNVAILYRRQITGKAFQTSFRNRKIPFNIHGVAFYRKKVIKAIMGILRTTLPNCDDGPFHQAFKALLPVDKEEKKMVIGYVEKVSSARKCSFISAASDIFGAKVSGTFKRVQLTNGRKVLSTLDILSKLVKRERSISVVISSAANVLPQKYLLEKRAVVDADGCKLLNEDNDLRSVLQYLLDDVSDFLSTHFTADDDSAETKIEERGCTNILRAFIDYISERESENFRSRRQANQNSVTLTTIHQSKGLEWDTVFIVKANDNEIPLLHEFNGIQKEGGATLEEERRLLYVAITRARKKLYILYVIMDCNWQLLQPSRFLKEIPQHLVENQSEATSNELMISSEEKKTSHFDMPGCEPALEVVQKLNTTDGENFQAGSAGLADMCIGNNFLKRFSMEERSVVSHLFHQWAKKQAFQHPKRLLEKVPEWIVVDIGCATNRHILVPSLVENSTFKIPGKPEPETGSAYQSGGTISCNLLHFCIFIEIGFVTDERLRNKAYKHKDVMRSLKSSLSEDEASLYARYVLSWEKIPADQRAHLMKEKQEHFLKQRIENSMGSSEATAKQISYLQNLGCTVKPTSRLHASHLIEQYKSL